MLNRSTIEQTVRELTGIANRAEPSWTQGKVSSRTFGTPSGNFYSLFDDVRDNFEAIVRRLLNHGDWSAKFSETHMINCVRNVLSHAIDAHSTDFIAPDFSDLLKELEGYSTEHTVYVPIQGLAMTVPDIKMGSVFLRSVVGDFNARIDEFCSRLEGFRAKNLPGIRVFAEYHAVAEPLRAEERAEDEARRVVDVLRYWMS